MSWFDKLFGEDNDSNSDLLRKNKKRRQSSQSQQNNQDSLLPQNNDIYNRPRGKFRFPMQVSEETSAQYEEHSYDESETSGYQAYSDSNYTQDYGQTYTTDSYGKRHRRRRASQMTEGSASDSYQSNHVDKQTSHEPKRNSRRNTYSQSNAQKDHKKENHHPRTKLQSERLKSKSQLHSPSSSEFTYHRSSFKASEVPSAIFGTKKRRPIENGVIPPKQESQNDDSKDKNNKDSDSKQSQRHASNEYDVNMYRQSINSQMGYQQEDSLHSNQPENSDNKQQSMNSSRSQQSSHEQLSTQESSHQSKGKTPNYSKRDNTINIENIYASQIVEEIRRERERKVLQKRRFKKALQAKRQQNQNSEEDSIQKAIDEMYAKQAHQYIGESSLDEDDNENHIDVELNDSSDHPSTKSFEEDQIGASSYNYEEINLDDEHHIQKLNDEDVQVNDSPINSGQDNENELNKKDEEIEDAQFHELDDSQQQSDETTHSEQEDSKQHQYNEAINQSVDNETEYAKHRDIDDTDQSSSSSESFKEQPSETIQSSQTLESEHATSTSEPHSTSSSQESQSQGSEMDTEVSHSKSEAPAKPKQRFGGSRPFNVLMTPSDKKRMMDSKKEHSVNVPELKPEQRHKQNASYSTNESSRSSESESGSTTYSTSSNEDSNDIEHSESMSQQDYRYPNPKDAASNNGNDENLQSNNDDHDSNTNDVETSNTDFHFSEAQNIEDEHELNSHMSHQVEDHEETTTTHNSNVTQEQDSNHHEHQSQQQPQHQGIRKGPNIKLPSFDLLEEPEPHEINEEWIEEKKQELNDALYYFNVPAEVKNVTEGPSVTRFELSVEKGVKVSRITALQDDIKMALAAKDIRIEAPIPGTSLVGIEVPNQNPTKVNLRSIIETPKFKNTESKLTVAMGYRINNEPLLMDIAKTPHALIAGATGSGKSVCINSILMSLLYKNHPEELRLLLIDPKMVELAPYNDLPHLVSPVITDVKAATQSLKWAVEEMEKRYKLFAQYHVRNITAFNKKAPYEQRMPKIVIVIDELADLMMMAPQEVEQSIARIAQKARACGIHMLVATQRPSVNVITGLIKANIPTRIAFMVSSSVDSRTILDSGGAERLLGYGDMLYLGSGMNKPIRVQGTFVSDEEIDDVVDFIKQQRDPEYLFEEKELLKKTQSQAQDDLFDDVCEFMVNEGHISTSLIQRHFQIGYNRAARIIDQLEQLGYISGANGSKPRDVYITEADLKAPA